MFLILLKKIYYFLLDIAQTLILAAAAFVVIYMFLFRPFEVSGTSMYPNLKDKQFLVTNIINLRFKEPKLGDIIVFKAPIDAEKDFIKRVIGVPGDKIYLKDGQVYLNDKFLDESKYLNPGIKTYGGGFLKEGDIIQVPPDSYFALGDNRSYSSDSRSWGYVPKKNLIGISFFSYWPLQNAGFINNPY